ncbi:MAG: SDR family oxidoreductase [Actinomycetes bacterium]
MRVLLTGGAGLVAGHVVRSAPHGVELHATWRQAAPVPGPVAHRLDLCDAAAVSALVAGVRPDVVVHTAYSQASEPDVVDATRSVARAVARAGSRLVHLSSDMVFDGEDAPYDEDAEPGPVNDYGRWKLQAEQEVRALVPDALVTRTSLVSSGHPLDHQAQWLVRTLSAGEAVTLFHDEYRSPVRADDLAAAIWDLVGTEATGIVHLAGPERLSRAEIGLRCAEQLGLPVGLVGTASAAAHPEPRPRDLTLSSRRRPNSVGRPVGW